MRLRIVRLHLVDRNPHLTILAECAIAAELLLPGEHLYTSIFRVQDTGVIVCIYTTDGVVSELNGD